MSGARPLDKAQNGSVKKGVIFLLIAPLVRIGII